MSLDRSDPAMSRDAHIWDIIDNADLDRFSRWATLAQAQEDGVSDPCSGTWGPVPATPTPALGVRSDPWYCPVALYLSAATGIARTSANVHYLTLNTALYLPTPFMINIITMVDKGRGPITLDELLTIIGEAWSIAHSPEATP